MATIQNIIEEEIKATIKSEKPLFLSLIKEEHLYKGVSSVKIEGEYFLNSKNITNIIVNVKYNNGIVVISGIESSEEKLDAYLLKNNAAILTSVKEKLQRDNLLFEPAFLVGPPGTGKSTVIAETIKESIKTQRILVLSPTHMAVGATC